MITKQDFSTYGQFTTLATKLSKRRDLLAVEEFLGLCQCAIKLKKKLPRHRTDIAYDLVCVAANTEGRDEDPRLDEIADAFIDLELPDAHVNTSDGLSVEAKWTRVEELVDALVAEISA